MHRIFRCRWTVPERARASLKKFFLLRPALGMLMRNVGHLLLAACSVFVTPSLLLGSSPLLERQAQLELELLQAQAQLKLLCGAGLFTAHRSQ